MLLPVIAISLVHCSSSLLLSNKMTDHQSITCNQQNQVIASSYANSGNENNFIQGVEINPTNLEHIKNIMYPWEVESLLHFESYTSNLRFADTTFAKNLWTVPDGILSSNAFVSTTTINKIDNYSYKVRITVKDGRDNWVFPWADIKFKNIQLPTEFLLLQPSLKKNLPSDIIDTVFVSGFNIKRNVYCNIPNGKSFFGDNLKIVDFHNNNEFVKKLYPSELKYIQPVTTFAVGTANDNTGNITLNVNFSGGLRPANYDPFRIAYFDNNGEPVRFYNDQDLFLNQGINQSFQISGFQVKTSPFTIFNGKDGQFLMYEIIGVGVLLFLTILYTIIHISRKNKRLSSVRRVSNRDE